MSVRARWGSLGDSSTATREQPFDPFEVADSERMPQTIDMTLTEDELHTHLVELVRQEGNLDACGVSCALKDLPEASCIACPVKRVKSDDLSIEDARSARLCEIGVEQDRVATMILAKRHGFGRQ